MLDDFEVSIFLTETNTRHSLLYKHKHFRDKVQTKLTSNSNKLTGETRDAPVDVDGGFSPGGDSPSLRREESDNDEPVNLDDIPTISEPETSIDTSNRRSKRQRHGRLTETPDRGNSSDGEAEVIDSDPSEDGSEANSDDSLGHESWSGQPPSKRRKDAEAEAQAELDSAGRDDKKKLAMDISYEGFAIYGRVLCLVVKRLGPGGGRTGSSSTSLLSSSNAKAQTGPAAGQAMMENWITSTQLPAAAEGDELEA